MNKNQELDSKRNLPSLQMINKMYQLFPTPKKQTIMTHLF